nr:hypothetical protein [Tanacetum cinerariifolium]
MVNDEEDHALVADEVAPTEFALMANTSAASKRSDKIKDGLGYSVVPPPPAQLYLSPKKDLSWTGLPECADDTVTDYSRPSPTIKSTLGDDQNRNPSVSETGSSQNNIDDKGYWDSGCSWHMTGNISYLSDFEPFDGGYVSFGQGGCKVTGKGTIKTGKLEFENVYFVKDLKDFKLLDDANILLRTLRQHNMYSIDLNNIVPHRDLTYLVAKASANECMLWHRRLGHLNFKTMNKLVRHNLVRGLPTKCFENDHTCTACLKGKQHKASFNTAGYVQNRVLVNKSHNKTPYELFNGRSPAIGFLKPFGCQVMILNTLENLGKFKEKGDEGTKDAASQEVKKNVSSLRYIALPNWAHDALLEFSSSKPQDHCSTEVPEGSGNPNPTASTSYPPVDQMETLTVETPIPTTLVDCPKRVRPIRTKWVLKNKKDERGIVIKNKARPVAQGHTQEEGINYDEVFLHVARIEAIRLFLAYASFMGFTIYQMDVKSAFLYGTMDEEVGTIDQTLFIRKQREDFILVQVYVDDIIFGSSYLQLCRGFKALMHEKFQMSAMGDILKKFGYSEVRHQVTPKEYHLHAVKRIFRYLKGHTKLGLWYPKESPFDLVAFSDSDYGGATQDRKSTSGGCPFLGRRLNSWQCKKQTIVATSTTEEEYVTAASCCGQVLWIQNQLLDYGYNFMNTKIYIDNNSAIDLLTKPFDAGRFQYLVVEHAMRGFVKGKIIIYTSFFWSTARIETTDEGTQILATMDGIHRTVTESSLMRNLKLQDEEGIRSLPDTKLFENLTLMGNNISLNQKFTFQKGQFSHQWKYLIHTIMQCISPKSTGFNDFSSNIATALVCLATNRTYNFSKMIFDGLVKNVNNKISKFLMYPRARIAQSYALPTVADESASPHRDVSQGEACPTDSGFIADQDRETIAKSSTFPYDSAPRVTSPVAGEGSMQQTIPELMNLCTSLQRQLSELTAKFQAQEVAINSLKERVKMLEDREGVAATRSGDDASIKRRSMKEGKAATERISDNSEEMVTVLTSMDAATILSSGVVDVPTSSGSIPTASTPAEEQVPTGSDVVPTTSPVFATATVVTPYSRRKGKEVMVESETLKKQRVQEQIDPQEEAERIKRKGINLEQESAKKQKTSEEIPEEAKSPEEVTEEKVKEMMQLVLIEEVYVKSLQVKHPIIDWKRLVKETLSNIPPTSEKEMELWVKLNRMYEPNDEDQLWTHTQKFMHAPVEWKLYDSCGVHHVTAKDKEIFMLVEKDYPLRKDLALVMICYKLQVENYSRMASDLILKIYKITSSPSQQEHMEILEREFKKLKRSRIAIVKVRWNLKRGPEFMWEREDQMKL